MIWHLSKPNDSKNVHIFARKKIVFLQNTKTKTKKKITENFLPLSSDYA